MAGRSRLLAKEAGFPGRKPANAGLRRLTYSTIYWKAGFRRLSPASSFDQNRSRLTPAFAGSCFLWAPREGAGQSRRKPAPSGQKPAPFGLKKPAFGRKKPAFPASAGFLPWRPKKEPAYAGFRRLLRPEKSRLLARKPAPFLAGRSRLSPAFAGSFRGSRGFVTS